MLLQTDYKKVIPPPNQTTNEEPKRKVGHDVIIVGEEERDITEDNISEDGSVG